MKKLVIVIISIIFASFFVGVTNAQNPSLELSWLSGSWNPGAGPTMGPSTATQLQSFQQDLLNNSNFTNYTPALTVTTSLRNQKFTGYNYTGQEGTVTTGLSFGTQQSDYFDPNVTTQGPHKGNLFDLLGANVGGQGPTASLYRSFSGEPLGTIDADFSQFGSDGNGGVTVFTTVEPLRDLPGVNANGRYEYGELVITFSRPVKDPVVNIASLGGSSFYQLTVGSPWNIAYYSTELELTTPGVTSQRLSGTPYFDIQGNKILNNALRPNGASQAGATDVKGFSTYGAASGSVQIIGTVTELVYKVYMKGSTLSDYPFTFNAVALLGAARNPFYGDFWAITYSLKKPTQQIFGNIFIDKDATDGDINKSFGIPNERTNADGQLYANLILGGLVVGTVPVGANGAYAFDNVLPGVGYTVQITTNQGVVGSPKPATVLPPNWTRTGEWIGSGPGTNGVTGTSRSFDVVPADIITNVNFGIKAGNCPNNILYTNPPAATGYYGGFELAQNFFPTGTNLSNGPGRIYAITPLAAANYRITSNPNVFDNTLSSYNSLGGANQMVVKPTANNQLAYYLVDSLGKNGAGFQTYLLSGTGANFKGWFAKAGNADAIVKIKIYDADDASKVFVDANVSVTGIAGNWVYFDKPWTVNYGTPGVSSLTKKVRLDIISVNGAPFSIDELCFTESNAGPTLPISLSEFTANKSACTANLVWKTSSEGNSDRFEVEVKGGVTAGFAPVGTVAAAGNSSTTKTYQFSYQMQTGVNYYFRIKMIDKDGSFTYSDTRTLNCSKFGGGIVIAPNPVVDIFNIRGMEDGKNLVTVYSASGQLVRSQIIAQNQGDVNIFNLAPGMYTVKITSEKGNTVVEKLIKY